MKSKPRLLDAFCGAGGCAKGYQRAGFHVTGIDDRSMPNYAGDVFIQGDAIVYIAAHGREFDVIHVSPPCKVHTSLKAFSGVQHVNLIPPTRRVLRATGLPWVIENVPGAPLIDPITLCGSSFGLGVQRHRLFESSVELSAPACDHRGQAARSPGYPVLRYHSGVPVVTMSPVVGVYGRGQGLGPGEKQLWETAMGIDWMTRDQLAQAIPPCYTQFIGYQLKAKTK